MCFEGRDIEEVADGSIVRVNKVKVFGLSNWKNGVAVNKILQSVNLRFPFTSYYRRRIWKTEGRGRIGCVLGKGDLRRKGHLHEKMLLGKNKEHGRSL